MEQTIKPFYQSKTFWVQVLGVLALAWPVSSSFIQQHFTEAGMGWILINTVLRFITKDKVSLT